jgi:thioredoxin reductase (NADPH)
MRVSREALRLRTGDVRSDTTKRVAFAVGDGALAVTCAHHVLGEL